MKQLAKGTEQPNPEQKHVLDCVRRRIVLEIELEKEGEGLAKFLKKTEFVEDPREEPLKGFVHGGPGGGCGHRSGGAAAARRAARGG